MIIVQMLFIESNVTTNPSDIILTAVIITCCIIADLFIFSTIRHAEKAGRIETENYYLQEQLTMQLAHYGALKEQHQAMWKMQHDIINHVQTLQVLISDDKENWQEDM